MTKSVLCLICLAILTSAPLNSSHQGNDSNSDNNDVDDEGILDKSWEEQLTYIKQSILRVACLQSPENRNAFLQDGINFLLYGVDTPRRIPETDKRLMERMTAQQKREVADYIETLKEN